MAEFLRNLGDCIPAICGGEDFEFDSPEHVVTLYETHSYIGFEYCYRLGVEQAVRVMWQLSMNDKRVCNGMTVLRPSRMEEKTN